MNKFTHLVQFVQLLFDETETVRKAKRIIEGILKARSPRLSDYCTRNGGQGKTRITNGSNVFLKDIAPRDITSFISGKCLVRNWRSN